MKSASEGFTIVEAIIFLAVSSALLIVAITFLSGREASTRFSQSMRDIQSKMQDWINDTPTGFAGGTGGFSGQYYCFSNPGGRVKIMDKSMSPPFSPSNPNHTRPDCIFLGKAVQFTDNSWPDEASKIYTYSVFGRRTYTPTGEDERLVANLAEAEPFAAVGDNTGSDASGTADLTDTYIIRGGAKVKEIIKPDSGALDNSHLASFYLSFNQTSIKTSGAANLTAHQYPLAVNSLPGNTSGSSVPRCLRLLDDCSTISSLTDWQICFESNDGVQTAVLSVAASDGQGVTTKLEFKPC